MKPHRKAVGAKASIRPGPSMKRPMTTSVGMLMATNAKAPVINRSSVRNFAMSGAVKQIGQKCLTNVPLLPMLPNYTPIFTPREK